MPRMSRLGNATLAATLTSGMMALGATTAHARATRPLFEPTDLEMEESGVAEIDLQFGGIRSRPGPWRLVLPDFELDLGILPNLEIDVDGAYAIEGPANGPFALDHAAPDSLWPSIKLGLFDQPSQGGGLAFALGVQAGPKLAVATGSHGLGFESLALLGIVRRRVHLALNVGGFADPAPDATSPRPRGFETGLDISVDLGSDGRFALTGELSAVRFLSADPAQLLATSGLTWSVLPFVDLSVVGVWGVLNGSDRYGVLFGASPKMRLFGSSAKS
jgi:hypothetical protein